MPICIAGMHRAGTSMITRFLHLSGVYLGPERDIVLTGPDNTEGFWEHRQFVALNDAVLAAMGGAWDVPPVLPVGWERSPQLALLREQAAGLVGGFAGREPWGWKDPRNSLTLPFWQQVVPDLKVVVCVRSPLDVAYSLHRRGYASSVFGFGLWQVYYAQLLASVPLAERVVTHYESYFLDAGGELRRVLAFLGVVCDEGVIERAVASRVERLRHHRTSVRDLFVADMPAEVLRLYLALGVEAGPVYQQVLHPSGATDVSLSMVGSLSDGELEGMRVRELRARFQEYDQQVRELRGQVERQRRLLVGVVGSGKGLSDAAGAYDAGDVSVLEEQVRAVGAKVAAGERAQQELMRIQSSGVYQAVRVVVRMRGLFAEGSVWQGFRRGVQALRRFFFRSSAGDGFVWSLGSGLSQPLVVGAGNVAFVEGWCFHRYRGIRRLSMVVDGVVVPIVHYGLARPDVFQVQVQAGDSAARSLMSGFWVALPFTAIDGPRCVRVQLRAVLDSWQRCEVDVGELMLLPYQRAPMVVARPSVVGEAFVVICMTTYNSVPALFEVQVDSIIQQTHQNWVCIVSDDCSDEGAFAEICRIAGRDPRFYVCRNGERLGFYRNFEHCLSLVPDGADFVAFADHDDCWYADKLAVCLAAFESDVMLVYSDMDIVDRAGRVLSRTYWTTRRNNYTDLAVLLFANTVTGAASVFRAGLLPLLLPFPNRVGDSFHDHWVACVALVRGRIAYVDRALYAYRQHGDNIIGHYVVPDYRLFASPGEGVRWFGRLVLRRTTVLEWLTRLRSIYFRFLLNIILLARILLLRIPDMSRERRVVLAEFARFDVSFLALVRQAIRYKRERRPTLGHELYCLRGFIARWLYDGYYVLWRVVLFQRRRLRAVIGGGRGAVPTTLPQGAQDNVQRVVDALERKVAPLVLDVSAECPRRVNVLISTIDFRYLFAGYIGMLNLMLSIQRRGYRVRMVIVDACTFDVAGWQRELRRYEGLDGLFERVEVAYCYDRSVPLPVHMMDGFVATSWWTAHIAAAAARVVGQERVVFFVQEYEPMFYPQSSLQALAVAAYGLPHFAIFSTECLRDYFRQQRIGVFAEGVMQGEGDSIAVQNAVSAFPVRAEVLRGRASRRLLFYARPEAHAARNLFELGVLALRALVELRYEELRGWEVHGIGGLGSYAAVPLYGDVVLTLMPKVDMAAYLELLPTYDVGLSLMLTPHPSMVPLDMAAAGLVTVTNCYATKTSARLSAISSNIIAVEPTVAGVVAGLVAALERVVDFEGRAEGARVRWPTSWGETFDAAVMDAICRFVEQSCGQEVAVP